MHLSRHTGVQTYQEGQDGRGWSGVRRKGELKKERSVPFSTTLISGNVTNVTDESLSLPHGFTKTRTVADFADNAVPSPMPASRKPSINIC